MKKIKYFLSYLIISGIAFSNSDTAIVKTYYEKFEEAVQYFKEGRFRLSEHYFNIILKKTEIIEILQRRFSLLSLSFSKVYGINLEGLVNQS